MKVLIAVVSSILVLYLVLDPDGKKNSFVPQTIAFVKRELKITSEDAEMRLKKGHSLFSQGRRQKALRLYGKALALDANVADEQLLSNLLESYGTKAQAKAAKLISKHNLTDTEQELRNRLRSEPRSARLAALQTLVKLDKATREDRIEFLLQDLLVKDCDIRLNAVRQLGNVGDDRAISALIAANRKDKKETPWYQPSCLDTAALDAIKKIRKRNR